MAASINPKGAPAVGEDGARDTWFALGVSSGSFQALGLVPEWRGMGSVAARLERARIGRSDGVQAIL